MTQAAVVLGAVYVEKHLTLARAMKGTDHAASLEPDGLRKLVRNIRNVEAAMVPGPLACVNDARKKLARSLVSTRMIRTGEVITEDMLTLKSPGDGMPWSERHRILGGVVQHSMPANTTIDPAWIAQPLGAVTQ